jgi:hypothetical protein
MAFVHLNPIRACLCNTPKASDHTNIKERIASGSELKKAADDEIKQQQLEHFH